MSILSRKIPVAPVKKRKYKKRKEKSGIRTGRWNRDECTAFVDGLKRHGKGRWKQIAIEIPTRTSVQVKTHAQMFFNSKENKTETQIIIPTISKLPNCVSKLPNYRSINTMNLRLLFSTIYLSPSANYFTLFPQTTGIYPPKTVSRTISAVSPAFHTRLVSKIDKQKKLLILQLEKVSEEELANDVFLPKIVSKTTSATSPAFQISLISKKEEQKKSSILQLENGSEEEVNNGIFPYKIASTPISATSSAFQARLLPKKEEYKKFSNPQLGNDYEEELINGVFQPKIESRITSAISTAFQISLCSEKEEQKKSSIPQPEKGSEEELMYSLGIKFARQLGDIRPLVENRPEWTHVARGLLDTLVGKLTEKEQIALLNERGQELNELITARANKILEAVSQAGDSMLENMSKKEGVETLGSGVRVHILDKPAGVGGGLSPTVASSIKVHYQGTLPDGTTFDTTLDGEPIKFSLGQVIPGWREALLKMHEGETAMVGIPSAQAYGKAGSRNGIIPGGCAIFFKVQLLKVLSAGTIGC